MLFSQRSYLLPRSAFSEKSFNQLVKLYNQLSSCIITALYCTYVKSKYIRLVPFSGKAVDFKIKNTSNNVWNFLYSPQG